MDWANSGGVSLIKDDNWRQVGLKTLSDAVLELNDHLDGIFLLA
jgi:hypothetical protein